MTANVPLPLLALLALSLFLLIFAAVLTCRRIDRKDLS